jgi:hypothetical protein
MPLPSLPVPSLYRRTCRFEIIEGKLAANTPLKASETQHRATTTRGGPKLIVNHVILCLSVLAAVEAAEQARSAPALASQPDALAALFGGQSGSGHCVTPARVCSSWPVVERYKGKVSRIYFNVIFEIDIP